MNKQIATGYSVGFGMVRVDEIYARLSESVECADAGARYQIT